MHHDASAEKELKNWKSRINKRLQKLIEEWGANQGDIHQALVESISTPGKRIRGLLVMASAKAVHQRPTDYIDLACSIEMVHTASLILDDMPFMDNADYRRGRPALHREYGEAVATLVSISLLSRAFYILGKTDSAPISELYRRLNTVRAMASVLSPSVMIGGQYLDLSMNPEEIAESKVKIIANKKTAGLFTAAAVIVGIMAGVSRRKEKSLHDLAEKLGLAFQIIDDLKDVKEDITQNNRHINLATTLGQQMAHEEAKNLIGEILEEIKAFGPSGNSLKELILQVNSLLP